jgi:hypothetical protein
MTAHALICIMHMASSPPRRRDVVFVWRQRVLDQGKKHFRGCLRRYLSLARPQACPARAPPRALRRPDSTRRGGEEQGRLSPWQAVGTKGRGSLTEPREGAGDHGIGERSGGGGEVAHWLICWEWLMSECGLMWPCPFFSFGHHRFSWLYEIITWDILSNTPK